MAAAGAAPGGGPTGQKKKKKMVAQAVVKNKAKKKNGSDTVKGLNAKPVDKKAKGQGAPESTKGSVAEPKVDAPAAKAKQLPEAGRGEAAEAGAARGKAYVGKTARRSKARRLEEAQAKADAEDEEERQGGAAAAGAEAAASDEPRGVVYVAHIPKGFFEPQMRKFFGQFGKVTRLRISRSKRNAASKGYAWVEFEEEEVAKIAQQTMAGYLLFGKKLRCEMVPKEKQHPKLFKGCRRRMVNSQNRRRRQAREVYNNRPTAEVDGEVVPRPTLRAEEKRQKSAKKLQALLERLEVKYDVSIADEGTGGEGGAGAAPEKVAPAAAGAPQEAAAAPAAPPATPAPRAAAAGAGATAKAAKAGKRAAQASKEPGATAGDTAEGGEPQKAASGTTADVAVGKKAKKRRKTQGTEEQ